MLNILENFLLRAPLYPIENLKSFDVNKIRKDPNFIDIIYTSSESLYNTLIGKVITKDSKKEVRQQISVYKYYTRMCTRCTPFEKLSTYSIGMFNSNDTILFKNDQIGHITYDTSLFKIVKDYIINTHNLHFITKQRYYANPTLYKKAHFWHYIEKEDLEYKYSQIKSNLPLNSILKLAKDGTTYKEIQEHLLSIGADANSANVYIQELITNKIIIPEIEYFIPDSHFFEWLNRMIHDIPELKHVQKFITSIPNPQNSHNNNDYTKINLLILDKIKQTFNINHDKAITIDTERPIQGGINNSIKKEISNFLELYSKICYIHNDVQDNLKQFTECFKNRYGESTYVPLLEALDPSIGIGYPVTNSFCIKTPLLEGLVLPSKKADENHCIITPLEKIILKKILSSPSSLKCNIYEDDIIKFPVKENIFPPSFSIMLEIFEADKIYFKGISYRTAISPLTRYRKHDNNVTNIIKKIVNCEQKSIGNEQILSDIIFRTDSELDNILGEKFDKMSKLTLLSNSQEKKEFDLKISDIYISYNNGYLKLLSPKYNKEILPINISVHNYNDNDFTYYNFLSEFSLQKTKKTYLRFNSLYELLDFIPRICLENIILLPASWKITHEEITMLEKYTNAQENSFAINEWKIKRKLKSRATFFQDDKSLLIDWSNRLSIKSFIQTIKKAKLNSVWVSEFLYDDYTSAVKDESNRQYANEVLLFCINQD